MIMITESRNQAVLFTDYIEEKMRQMRDIFACLNNRSTESLVMAQDHSCSVLR